MFGIKVLYPFKFIQNFIKKISQCLISSRISQNNYIPLQNTAYNIILFCISGDTDKFIKNSLSSGDILKAIVLLLQRFLLSIFFFDIAHPSFCIQFIRYFCLFSRKQMSITISNIYTFMT